MRRAVVARMRTTPWIRRGPPHKTLFGAVITEHQKKGERSVRTSRLGLVLLAAFGLAVSACGSSSKSSSSTSTTGGSSGATSGTSAAGSSAAKLSGSTFTFGVVTNETGSNAGSYVGGPPAAKAWQDWVNSHGGINGHPVSVVVEDSGGDAGKGLSAVEDMVQNKGALAIVTDDTVTDDAIVSYSKQEGFPVVSVYTGYPQWTTTPGWFGLGAGTSAGNQAALAIIKAHGYSSAAAVVCEEVAACGEIGAAIGSLAPKEGVRFDGTLKVLETQPDYTAQCLALKAKGTGALLMEISSSGVSRFYSDCTAQGYDPAYSVNEHALGPEIEQVKGNINILSTNRRCPGMRTFRPRPRSAAP